MFRRVSKRSMVAYLAAAAALVTPVAASAQCPVPLMPGSVGQGSIIGVLNETMESPRAGTASGSPLLGGAFTRGVRIAQATEKGALSVSPCGSLAGLAGTITVQAQSVIPVSGTDSYGLPILGSGPIRGSFKVQAPAGEISGKLDGSLMFTKGSPVVAVFGSWNVNGSDGLAGSFGGVALVPFPYGQGWFYVDPTGLLASSPGAMCAFGGTFPSCKDNLYLVPLQAGDFNQHGSPEAKFIINMYQL
jgi:hypothetical protein